MQITPAPALDPVVEIAQCDPRLSASSGSLFAYLVASRTLSTLAPRPLKVRALALAVKRYDRTVTWCLNQLVLAGYLRVAGKQGSARCFLLADTVPHGAAEAVRTESRTYARAA